MYQITYNADSNEGRGPRVKTDIIFKDQYDALNFVKSDYYAEEYGVMSCRGNEHDISFYTPPNIYSNIEMFEKAHGVIITNAKEAKKARVVELKKFSHIDLVNKIMELENK